MHYNPQSGSKLNVDAEGDTPIAQAAGADDTSDAAGDESSCVSECVMCYVYMCCVSECVVCLSVSCAHVLCYAHMCCVSECVICTCVVSCAHVLCV
jgi:hypothetical protein